MLKNVKKVKNCKKLWKIVKNCEKCWKMLKNIKNAKGERSLDNIFVYNVIMLYVCLGDFLDTTLIRYVGTFMTCKWYVI